MESKITPQFYVEWLKKNINEIAEKCGWAEITAIQKEPLELHNEENAVICFSTLHKDGIKTYYLCEICDEEMPFSAVMESFIAMQAIQTGGKVGGRIVVVSPEICEKFACGIKSKSLPINLLKANPDECKYWSCEK